MSKLEFYKSQCLFYALDKVKQEGGYITFGMSEHWDLQHAAHYDNLTETFTGFIPPAKLSHPVKAVTGFWGFIETGDTCYRKPMTPKMMWRGIQALVIGFWVWRFKRWIDNFRPIP